MMIIKHPAFIVFAFFTFSECTYAQGKEENKNEFSYLDSAMYHFQQSQVANRIDTIVFEKGLAMLYKIDVNEHSVSQIETIAKDLKNKYEIQFSNVIYQTLLSKLTSSDSLDFAIQYCKNLIQNYDVSRNPDERSIALSALTDLRIPFRKKSIPETFDYYTSRLKIYLEKNDSAALAISYFCLGTTYRLTGLPDMTIYNMKKSISYINKNDIVTTAPMSGLRAWMNNTSVLGQLYLEIGDYPTAITFSREARDARLNILKVPNVSFLTCNIAYAKLMLNELDSVNELLNNAIQLAYDAKDYPSLVRTYEIKGQYFLATNQLDSAESSLLKCKEIMGLHNIGYFGAAGSHTPDYYLAKVRILQNRFKDARSLLEMEIKEIQNIKKDVLKEQKLLIEVYNLLGDSKAAGETFKEYSKLQLIIQDEDRRNRTKSFEIESKITEAENTIIDLETKNKIANLTKRYLIGIAALLLLVAAIIFNRFRVTQRQKIIIEKEKHRSEELLLNILPSEVAEELKVKGSADAKHFDDVTVMFTDFKNFTQISEHLLPTELVNEIHTCFKAFDTIISKHNIEKIKTIGDAYMCAGGLPVANT
ncbi:MAG: adenylate/guanylate cyclase domain-containing protein, partial [Chitinophagales bacterium]